MKPVNDFRRRRRNGTTLIVVLVCLVAVTSILLGLVGTSIRHRGQVRTEVQLEQTYWLLDAGIGAAIAEFKRNPDFEELAVSMDEPFENYKGSVTINVLTRNETQLHVRVTAKLQGQSKHGPITQRSRIILLERSQNNQE